MIEENQDTNERINKRFRLSQSIVIAVFPFLGYLVVFFMEIGYLSSLDIPLYFIDFSLSQVVGATGTIIFLTLVGLSGVHTISTIVRTTLFPAPLARRVRFLLILMIFLTPFALLNISNPYILDLIYVIVVAFLFAMFVPPLILVRGPNNFAQKLDVWDEKMSGLFEKYPSLPDEIGNLIGPYLYAAIIFLPIGFFMLFFTGYNSARYSTSFWTVNTNPEMVVLYWSGDKMICAPFNRSKREIEPIRRILDYSSSADLEFRREEIGPLKLRAVDATLEDVPTITSIPTTAITSSPTIELTDTPNLLLTPSPSNPSP